MTIFIPDLPEFAPLRIGLEAADYCRVQAPQLGYWRVDATREMVLSRRALGLSPALWYSCLSGGFIGRIVEFDRDTLRMIDE
jgi:hypothetical protein